VRNESRERQRPKAPQTTSGLESSGETRAVGGTGAGPPQVSQLPTKRSFPSNHMPAGHEGPVKSSRLPAPSVTAWLEHAPFSIVPEEGFHILGPFSTRPAPHLTHPWGLSVHPLWVKHTPETREHFLARGSVMAAVAQARRTRQVMTTARGSQEHHLSVQHAQRALHLTPTCGARGWRFLLRISLSRSPGICGAPALWPDTTPRLVGTEMHW
jgi:hypothetical protein